VRSLRAGHPVPIAITWWRARWPIRSAAEFGIVADEITYGADLETGMRNLYFRIGQDDLPLFVTAVAIQSSTGGNLGEILENLSAVIRQRFKMRRKIRALASEGPRLGDDPVVAADPDVYRHPDHHAELLCQRLERGPDQDVPRRRRRLDGVGNFIMFRMVNFRFDGWAQLDMLLNGGNTTMVGLWLFLATATLTFSIMAVVRVQGSVKRRAANIGRVDDIGRSVCSARSGIQACKPRNASSNTPPSITLRAPPKRPRCCAAG
jgi:hypothetical protein